MSFKFGGSGGGGGAGDTYTASTAVALIPVENGKSYALSTTGKLSPTKLEIEKRGPYILPNANVTDNSVGGANKNNANGVYGDMITPDGKASFHYITETSNQRYGIFYISLDNGNTNNGDVFNQNSGYPFSNTVGYAGAKSSIYVKLIGEEGNYWFYTMLSHAYETGGPTEMGIGFMVRKDTHEFWHNNSDGTVASHLPRWHARADGVVNYNLRLDVARQSRMFMETCRSGDLFVFTDPFPSGGTQKNGWVLKAVDTYRSSDSNYWGGTNIGLPKNTGFSYSGSTHRDNAHQEGHQPLFKVDDANGIFIAPYYCVNGGNNNEYVYIKYTIAANKSVSESEIAISGTDPAGISEGYGHWIATTNPLIFWYVYMTNSTQMYYVKLTFNSDWTSATWGTQATLTLSTTMSVGTGGSTWARDQDSITNSCKHSVPEKELFFLTGANSAAKNAVVLSFPATGTPAELGLTTLNNSLAGVYGQKMIMQSMNSGTMISLQHPWVSGGNFDRGEQGYAIYYTENFSPNFKKTADLVAVARADGAAGATVAIDLKTGDTASATLSTDYYFAKEGMSYPLDVEGGPGAASFTTSIKSIQRGLYALSAISATTSIATVDMDKSFISSSSSNDGGSDEDAYVQLSAPTTVTFTRNNNAGTTNVSWEVIEYV